MRNNVAFVLWMVLFPIMLQLSDYLAFLTRGSVVRAVSENTEVLAGLICFVVWIWVGYLLYEPRPAEREEEAAPAATGGAQSQ